MASPLLTGLIIGILVILGMRMNWLERRMAALEQNPLTLKDELTEIKKQQ